jgi:hypothetical protein
MTHSSLHTSPAGRFLWMTSVCASLGFACSGDPFTPDQCTDPPAYDIRRAQPGAGAVQEEGIVESSPVSSEDQRQLQFLARDGCVTLPAKGYSLGRSSGVGLPDSDEDADAGAGN